MFPGLNEADCRVAEIRYCQLVADGQRQQTTTGVLSARTGNAPGWSARRQVGIFLVRVGQRLQAAYPGETPRMGPAAANERAVA